jgi:16S rRNA (cytosine1402-N4)-methyltransferase
VSEVLNWLAPKPGHVVLDCTVGLGGHAGVLAERIRPGGRLIGLDCDQENVWEASVRLAGFGDSVRMLPENYADADRVLAESGVEQVDLMVADLGFSSNQMDDPQRGLSFLQDGPLDMRLDRRQPLTACELVNRLSEHELADLIYEAGQDRHSRRIAKKICQARRAGRLNSTVQLAGIVASAVGVDPASRRSRIHPATRTFMALRITVNGELENLQALLKKAPGLLRPAGRIAIISFHSLEDGLVKSDFRRRHGEGLYRILTKKPVVASAAERQENPRSRSAKLRVAERTEAPLAVG